jgi:hypothetical protein
VTAVFLALLAIAWIAVFLPAALRAQHSNPLKTSNLWRRRMAVIAPTSHGKAAGKSGRGPGRWVVVPATKRPQEDQTTQTPYYRSQRQRRHLFVFLLVATIVSGIAAVALRTPSMWEVHFAFAASLALYVLILIRVKERRAERAEKVRPLAGHRSADARLDDAVGYFANRRG